MVVTRSRAQFWNKLMASPPKMVPYPVSEPKVEPSPKSTEQKLAEALAEMAELKKSNVSLRDEFKKLTAENAELKTKNTGFTNTVKYLEEEIDSWKEQHKSAVDRCNQLYERIRDPFKSAISRPRL
jgi:chromosome segregation ATPase